MYGGLHKRPTETITSLSAEMVRSPFSEQKEKTFDAQPDFFRTTTLSHRFLLSPWFRSAPVPLNLRKLLCRSAVASRPTFRVESSQMISVSCAETIFPSILDRDIILLL